jgi:hypothetical protein
MVFDSSSLVSNLGGGASAVGNGVLYVFIGICVLVILGLVVWMIFARKRWNLKVEFKLVRSDGRQINAEWGKGYYDAKKGVVMIKRPTMGKMSKGLPIRIFDIRRYIQGDNIITVIQLGPEDYRPVLNDSWTEHVIRHVDSDTKEVTEVKEAVMNIKVDSGLNKAWKSSWDASAKKAYSIVNMLREFQTPIAIGIVIICCFVGFAVLWTKMPKCG